MIMAEKKDRTQLEKYTDVKIPSGIKVGIRLYFVDLMDVAVIGGTMVTLSQLQQKMALPGWAIILMYLSGFLLSLFAVLRMPYNPLELNWKVLLYAALYRRDRFYPLQPKPKNGGRYREDRN